jgi:hypothetical protein
MAISGRAGRGTLQTIFFKNLSQKIPLPSQPISKSRTKNSNIKNLKNEKKKFSSKEICEGCADRESGLAE